MTLSLRMPQRFVIDRSQDLLRASEVLRYARTRHNHETMLLTSYTHTFFPEAMEAASAQPCRNKPVVDGRWIGNAPALAERCAR